MPQCPNLVSLPLLFIGSIMCRNVSREGPRPLRCAIPGPLLPPPLLGSPSSPPPPHILPSLLPPYLCLHILSRPLFPPSHRPRHWTDATEGLRGRGGGCGETHLSLPLPFPPSLWRSKYRQLQIFRRPPTPLLCPAHGHYSERQRRYFRWVIPLLSFF